MIRVKCEKDFSYAYNGVDVVDYKAGEEYDLINGVAKLAIDEGWATEVKGKKKAKEAPENKSKKASKNKSDEPLHAKVKVKIGGKKAEKESDGNSE